MLKKLFILFIFLFVTSLAYGQGLGDDPGAAVTDDVAASDLGEISFEQKDQFQQALEDRINRLQNQVDRIRSANRSNWASVRSEALNALGGGGDVLSSPQRGAKSISTSPGMDATLESAPATGDRAADPNTTSPGAAGATRTGP